MIIPATGSTLWHQPHININPFTNTVRQITSLSLCFAFIALFLSFQRPANMQENSMTSSRQLLILEPASISNSNINSMAVAKRNKEENKTKKEKKKKEKVHVASVFQSINRFIKDGMTAGLNSVAMHERTLKNRQRQKAAARTSCTKDGRKEINRGCFRSFYYSYFERQCQGGILRWTIGWMDSFVK